MKNKLYKLPEMIRNNWGLKLVSLVLSVVIWMTVTNSNDPIKSITISNVPINIVNGDSVADIGKVAEPQGSGTVTLKVTERRSILNKLSRTGSNFRVEADLENINEMNAVPLTVTCDNNQVSWDEIAISPSSLKVTVEDKVEQPFFVNVTSSGEPMDGYTVDKMELSNEKSILIAGPQTLVEIINQVTAPITVSGLAQDSTVSTTIHIYDKNGAEFTEAQMNRLEIKDSEGNILEQNQVEVQVYMWQVKREIPLKILPTGKTMSEYFIREIVCLPSAVSLKGTPEALERIGDELIVEDMVDVTSRSESFSTEIDLNAVLEQWDDVKLMDDVDPMVNVEISIEHTGDIAVDLPLSNIELINKPEDMKLVFTPADKIVILVRSDGADTDTINAEDVKASIDLSACAKEGNYEIPVLFELPEGWHLSNEVVLKVSSMCPDEEPST